MSFKNHIGMTLHKNQKTTDTTLFESLLMCSTQMKTRKIRKYATNIPTNFQIFDETLASSINSYPTIRTHHLECKNITSSTILIIRSETDVVLSLVRMTKTRFFKYLINYEMHVISKELDSRKAYGPRFVSSFIAEFQSSNGIGHESLESL